MWNLVGLVCRDLEHLPAILVEISSVVAQTSHCSIRPKTPVQFVVLKFYFHRFLDCFTTGNTIETILGDYFSAFIAFRARLPVSWFFVVFVLFHVGVGFPKSCQFFRGLLTVRYLDMDCNVIPLVQLSMFHGPRPQPQLSFIGRIDLDNGIWLMAWWAWRW